MIRRNGCQHSRLSFPFYCYQSLRSTLSTPSTCIYSRRGRAVDINRLISRATRVCVSIHYMTRFFLWILHRKELKVLMRRRSWSENVHTANRFWRCMPDWTEDRCLLTSNKGHNRVMMLRWYHLPVRSTVQSTWTINVDFDPAIWFVSRANCSLVHGNCVN